MFARPAFPAALPRGAEPPWLAEEPADKSLLEVEKAWEQRGFLLGGRFLPDPAPGSREVRCGSRRLRGQRAGCGAAGGPRGCPAGSGRGRCVRAGGARRGRASGRTRREAPAGRAPRRGPGRGGRALPGLLSELSPLPGGRACAAAPAPAPSPARSREMFIWSVA